MGVLPHSTFNLFFLYFHITTVRDEVVTIIAYISKSLYTFHILHTSAICRVLITLLVFILKRLAQNKNRKYKFYDFLKKRDLLNSTLRAKEVYPT